MVSQESVRNSLKQILITQEIAKTLVKVYIPISRPFLGNKKSPISNLKEVLNVFRKKWSKKKEISWLNISASSLHHMKAPMNRYKEKYLVLKKPKEIPIERSKKNNLSWTT